jgi:SNF family Na+-dependent transporter
LTRQPAFKYVGVIGVLIPIIIYMYYVYIEAWCLGYAVNFFAGDLNFKTVEESGVFGAALSGSRKTGVPWALAYNKWGSIWSWFLFSTSC